MVFRLYLISPEAHSSMDYMGLEAGGKRIARTTPLGIATVAALAPPDFEVILCDEVINDVDFEIHADAVGVSANVAQASRALEIADAFRARGTTVVMGGPHVSLAPELFEGRCSSVVVGELEAIAEIFFADLRTGRLKPRYEAGKASMAMSPSPRWDLYPHERALTGVVQTSRGCPFECDFCDVIQYLGRVQRHKSDDQVISEVQALYDLGHNFINLADDNFTVYRRRARSLLARLREWNGREGRDYVGFSTQMSVDVARDQDLLELCADAGLQDAFIGIESINKESLRESGKRQNVAADLSGSVDRIVRAGLRVHGGLMVGFDHDGPDIFEKQFEFAAAQPIAVYNVNVLVAPVATPLYERMRQEDRLTHDELDSQVVGGMLLSNIKPAQMSRLALQAGAKWLISRLMHPYAFAERLQMIAERTGPNPLAYRGTGRLHRHPSRREADSAVAAALRRLSRSDEAAASVIRMGLELARRRPDVRETIMASLSNYAVRLTNFKQAGIYNPDAGRDPLASACRRRVSAIPSPEGPVSNAFSG